MSTTPSQSESPDTDELVAYLDGELSADECRRVERRLASDADYRRRLTRAGAGLVGARSVAADGGG